MDLRTQPLGQLRLRLSLHRYHRLHLVLRGLTPAEAVKSATRAWDAGVEHVEVTIETPTAVPSLVAVAGAAAERGVAVGAGTIIQFEQLDAAGSANASFTVSPGLDEAVIKESIRRGLPHLPGVASLLAEPSA